MTDLTTISLPQYREPSSLDDAKRKIIDLGTTLHECAYKLGKLLIWVKSEVGYGGFEQWVEANIWFSIDTAQRFMGFSKKCDNKGCLLEYHPRNTAPCGISAVVPGKYRTVIIDPPWPVKKIERYTRPLQEPDLDYFTMTIDAIKQTTFPFNNNCHVYLWAIQKYLPIAFEWFEAGGIRYIQTLVWHKNVGFTPMGLFMNNIEFVLFGRKGSLPLMKAGEKCAFFAKAREHSRKPDEFYDLVRKVSPEPRIDCFSRERREGFDQFGDQINKFGEDLGKGLSPVSRKSYQIIKQALHFYNNLKHEATQDGLGSR